MGNFINIYGASGSGKTQFILQNAYVNHDLTSNLSKKYKEKPSVSLLPLPDFDETVEIYLKFFDLTLIDNKRFENLIRNFIDIPLFKLEQRRFETLSAGEKRRFDLVRCALSSKVAIIDEPFANSSGEFQNAIIKFLKTEFYCVITLSHSEMLGFNNIRINELTSGKKISEFITLIGHK